MKGKTLLILLAAAGLLALLAWLRFGENPPAGGEKLGDRLLADLPVNAVGRVILADAEHQVTLVKGEGAWQVEERGGYPADFAELRDLVVRLSRLKIGRRFAATPESLTRLSLVAPGTSDTAGSGKRVTLMDTSGHPLADLILGQARQTEDGASGGQYLKMADGDTVFLVDGDFRFLKTAPAQWLQKEILQIEAPAVASVTAYGPDGSTVVYALARPQKDQPPAMTPLPAGRMSDGARIDQVFEALSPLTLDDVRPAGDTPGAVPAAAPRGSLVYRLYDGRQIHLFPMADDQGNYFLRVTADGSGPPADDAPAGQAAEGEPSGQPPAAAPSAEELNAALAPWIFSVKQWQFDSFVTDLEGLLEPEKKEGDGGTS